MIFVSIDFGFRVHGDPRVPHVVLDRPLQSERQFNMPGDVLQSEIAECDPSLSSRFDRIALKTDVRVLSNIEEFAVVQIGVTLRNASVNAVCLDNDLDGGFAHVLLVENNRSYASLKPAINRTDHNVRDSKADLRMIGIDLVGVSREQR